MARETWYPGWLLERVGKRVRGERRGAFMPETGKRNNPVSLEGLDIILKGMMDCQTVPCLEMTMRAAERMQESLIKELETKLEEREISKEVLYSMQRAIAERFESIRRAFEGRRFELERKAELYKI
ncbi:MAG: hypothetical protein JRE40_10135 [Deltaproteobacteria bacterium]|nr:hypothetical protein [Deltaproteobacteria bacterium]